MIAREFSDEEYPGGYHIVPNAGICILAMLYGKGELGRSIEISVMCGYDTDCNASNIGTILGVLGGLGGVPERYRRPINDLVTLSSVSGYLNLVDLSDKAKELGTLSCRTYGGALPRDIVCPKPGELRMDFPFPGSTHGLELSDKAEHTLRIVPGKAHSGAFCAELMTDGKRAGPVDLSFKAMLTRPDLHEERYDPVFTAKVNPGQRVGVWMKSEQTAPIERKRRELRKLLALERKIYRIVHCAGNGDLVHIHPAHDPGVSVGLRLDRPATAVTASVTVESGESALVLLRGQGTRRYYALGFSAPICPEMKSVSKKSYIPARCSRFTCCA